MPKTVWVFVLGLVAGSTGIPTTTFAQSEGLSLRIELRNDAQFRRNAIEAAQALVNGIYAHTDVHLIWTNQDPQLTVVLKGAHELGHLLISKEHAAVGIMQPDLNQPDFRNAREGRLFTSEQAKAVRQRARMLVTP